MVFSLSGTRVWRPGAESQIWDVNTMGYSHDGHSVHTDVSALPDCEALRSEIRALQRGISHLRDSVVSTAVIDQAIGVIIILGELRPNQGVEVLMAVSERTGRSVRVVAGYLVDWAVTKRLPEDILQALVTEMADAGTD